MAQTRKERLPALDALRWYVVGLALLNEHRTGLYEVECHLIFQALFAQAFHPFIVARTRPVVVLTSTQHFLYLTCPQILLCFYWSDERSRHKTLVLGRNVKQQGQSLVCSPLVLAGHVEHHVLIAIAPVVGQTLTNAAGSFGEQAEGHVRSLPDDAPSLRAPPVGFLQEEVGGESDVERHSCRYLISAGTVLLHRECKVLRAEDAGGVDTTLSVEEVHVAVLTALAHLVATVPGIPDDHIMQVLIVQFYHEIFLDK